MAERGRSGQMVHLAGFWTGEAGLASLFINQHSKIGPQRHPQTLTTTLTYSPFEPPNTTLTIGTITFFQSMVRNMAIFFINVINVIKYDIFGIQLWIYLIGEFGAQQHLNCS